MKETEKWYFHLNNHSILEQENHYKACGLDNVYLRNGFETGFIDGEPYTVVNHIEELHNGIASRLTKIDRKLLPKEIVFIRKYLDLSQEEVAKRLNIPVNYVIDYESGFKRILSESQFKLLMMVRFNEPLINKKHINCSAKGNFTIWNLSVIKN